MKEKLDGAVFCCDHWTHAPRRNEYTFRWSAFVEADGEGDNLQLLSAVVKDGLAWQKVPRGCAMFKDLQAGLRSFCELNGLEALQDTCKAFGAVYDVESRQLTAPDINAASDDGGAEPIESDVPAVCIKRAYFYSGHLLSPDVDGGRIQVEFQVPTGLNDPPPAQAELDASFMAGLAQKVKVYSQLARSNGSQSDYIGYVEGDEGCIAVSFSCASDATVAEKDVAHLAALAQKAQIDWVLLGEKIIAPVAVVGHNASGVPDVFLVQVVCGQREFDEGIHYEMAMAQAREHDFGPSIAFDPNDDAWGRLALQGMQATKPVVVVDVGTDGITSVRSNMAVEIIVLDSTWGNPDIETTVDGDAVHVTRPEVSVLDAKRFADLMGQIDAPDESPANSPLVDGPL